MRADGSHASRFPAIRRRHRSRALLADPRLAAADPAKAGHGRITPSIHVQLESGGGSGTGNKPSPPAVPIDPAFAASPNKVAGRSRANVGGYSGIRRRK